MTPDIKAIREANTGTDCSANIHPATVIALCDEVERLRKDAARYRWLAWKSDTNPIMPYDWENDRLYFGHECDAAIDAAMETKCLNQ